MDSSRLTKKIFIWDYTRALTGKKGWSKEIKKILVEADMEDTFYGLDVEKRQQTIAQLSRKLEDQEEEAWYEEVRRMPKLRTYQKIKLTYGTEPYIRSRITRLNRSTLAKFRDWHVPHTHRDWPVQEATSRGEDLS